MRRAVRAEQKEARRQQIVDVAWTLFQKQPYETLNVVDVAHGAGLAKGTVYLYFATKEALFLAVLAQQFEAWFTAVNAQLTNLPTPSGPQAIATLLGASLTTRPGLMRLFALLHVILERNVDRDAARAFKQMLRANVLQTGALLEAKLPFLAPGGGAALLLRIYALVLGIQQMADPAPVVAQLLESEADLALFKVDFGAEFIQTVTALIVGLQTQQAEA